MPLFPRITMAKKKGGPKPPFVPVTNARSVHVHRREVVLPRKDEGRAPVAHQRVPLAIGVMQRVKRFDIPQLGLHLLGQVGHGDRAHIDDLVARLRAEIEFMVHLCPLTFWQSGWSAPPGRAAHA